MQKTLNILIILLGEWQFSRITLTLIRATTESSRSLGGVQRNPGEGNPKFRCTIQVYVLNY